MHGSAVQTSRHAKVFGDHAIFAYCVRYGAQKHRSRRAGRFHVTRKIKDPSTHHVEGEREGRIAWLTHLPLQFASQSATMGIQLPEA